MSDLLKRPSLAVIALAATLLVVYKGALTVGFLSDDFIFLTDISNGVLPWITSWFIDRGLFRPVVTLSFLIDLGIHGPHAVGFHLTNILLHLTATLLLFLTLRSALRQIAPSQHAHSVLIAAIGAAVFGLHPAQSIDVIWIAGRSDLLVTVFGIACWLVFLEAHRRSQWGLHFIAAVALAISLLCKEIAVTIPVAIFAFIYAVERRNGVTPMRSLLGAGKSSLPLWFVVAGYLTMRLIFLPSVPPTLRMGANTIGEGLVLALKSVVLIVLPLDILSTYELFLNSPGVFIAILVLLTLVLAVILNRIFRSAGWMGIEEIVIPVAVVLTMSIPYILSGIVSQRLMYLLIAAVVLTLVPTFATMTSWLRRPIDRAVGGIVMLLVGTLFIVVSVRNVDHWRAVGELERSAIKNLTEQLPDIQTPVVIATYPHRILQTTVIWSFEHRLHFQQHGTFGRRRNVWAVVGIIGNSVDSLGWSVTTQPADSSVFGLNVHSRSPLEYLVVDRSQVLPVDIDVVERPGTIVQTGFADVRIDSLNGALRPSSCTVIPYDSSLWRSAAVFVWQDMKFVQLLRGSR